MSVLGDTLSTLAANGQISEIVWFVIAIVGAVVGGVALVYKGINFIKINLNGTDLSDATKKDIEELEESVLDDLKRVMKKIEEVEDKIDILTLREIELRQSVTPLERNIEKLSTDNDSRYLEINRNMQELQKDLASLHGTILGLGSDRHNLK